MLRSSRPLPVRGVNDAETITLKRVVKRYGHHLAVDDVSISIDASEFIVLLGPSGCGKTTLLRMLAGFVQPTQGEIFIGNTEVTRVPTRSREVGMVFQNYALFPNMTVAENIEFGLRRRRIRPDEIKTRVSYLMELVQLSSRADSYVSQLSGGQQQRVALARAIAYPPRVLLMDEPLGALDLKLREAMQIELKKLQRELKITTVFVTHDQHEAMALADRVVVMSNGRFHQVDRPETLYAKPTTSFVAQFVGNNNILTGSVLGKSGDSCLVDAGPGMVLQLPADRDAWQAGAKVDVAIRPENIRLRRLVDATESDKNVGRIESRQFFGSTVHYLVMLSPVCTLLVERPAHDEPFFEGDTVAVEVTDECVSVLEREGSASIA